MTTNMKVWIGIAIAAAGGIAYLAITDDGGSLGNEDSGKQRPDTPEGRRGFVHILEHSLPADSIWTEGARSQGLVLDLRDCTMRTLSDFVQRPEMTDRLWQFDFSYVRCTNGVRVDGPWAGHNE